jgi:hypothetical protein
MSSRGNKGVQWSDTEKQLYSEIRPLAIKICKTGREAVNWKAVSKYVRTRTPKQ